MKKVIKEKIEKELIPAMLGQSLADSCTIIGEYLDPFIENGSIEGVDYKYSHTSQELKFVVVFKDNSSIAFIASKIVSTLEEKE